MIIIISSCGRYARNANIIIIAAPVARSWIREELLERAFRGGIRPLNFCDWALSRRRCMNRAPDVGVDAATAAATVATLHHLPSCMQIRLRCRDVTTIVNISLIVKSMTYTTTTTRSERSRRDSKKCERSTIITIYL